MTRPPARNPCLFFFNDTATTEIYTLSLHDALPILQPDGHQRQRMHCLVQPEPLNVRPGQDRAGRSEEHTSELQSQSNLVCRLLLEKKKKQTDHITAPVTSLPNRPCSPLLPRIPSCD